MRHVSPTLRPFEGIERCEEVDMGGREAGVLSHAAVRRLRRAREEGTPLVLRAGLAREQIEAMRGDWEGFVRGHDEVFSTNQGVLSDVAVSRSRGVEVSMHARGEQRLRNVWVNPWRLETELSDAKGGCPVHDWVCGSALGVCRGLAATQRRLVEVAGQVKITKPSFVIGAIEKEGGGPTHFDDYSSWAMVFVGEKVFYISDAGTFDPRLGMGSKHNERTDKTPFDAGDAHLWVAAHLLPGDVLYLPFQWWHYVVSTRHCVMSNVWAHDGEAE